MNWKTALANRDGWQSLNIRQAPPGSRQLLDRWRRTYQKVNGGKLLNRTEALGYFLCAFSSVIENDIDEMARELQERAESTIGLKANDK